MEHLPKSRSGRNASDVAIEAAKTAGDVLIDRFHDEKKVTWKGKSNIVTDADVAAEKAITDLLRNEFPDHGVVAEESGSTDSGGQYTWVIDPLDGTNNFVFGIPLFCVSVSLIRGDEILLGITYDPIHKELFYTEEGGGATLNDSPIAVSSKNSLEQGLVGFDMGYEVERAAEVLSTASKLWPRMHSLRILGSGALGLAYVACGRLDVYMHRCLFPWDISSGMLLVREAGGIITDWIGNSASLLTCQVLAANPTIHQQFTRWYTGWDGRPDKDKD